MITIKANDFKSITQEKYNEATAKLDLVLLKCSCGHTGCLERHGYYERKLKTPWKIIKLRILRVRCKECGKTHAILPELVVPYSQIPADIQQQMLLYPLGSPELTKIMEDNNDITESNVLAVRSRFKKYWKERLLSMGRDLREDIAGLIRHCFAHFHRQFMQIRRGMNLAEFNIHIA